MIVIWFGHTRWHSWRTANSFVAGKKKICCWQKPLEMSFYGYNYDKNAIYFTYQRLNWMSFILPYDSQTSSPKWHTNLMLPFCYYRTIGYFNFCACRIWFCCCCCCCLDRTFDFVKFVFFAFWFDKSSASSNSWIYQCTNICIFVRALQRQQMALFSLSLSGFNEFTTNQLSQQMNKWKCFLCEVVVFGDHCNLHTRALFDKWYSVYCLAYIWTQMRPWSRMKWVEAGKKPHHNTQRCNKSNDIFNAFPLIIRDEASNRPDFTS